MILFRMDYKLQGTSNRGVFFVSKTRRGGEVNE